jgi:hypothetical protein
VSATASHQLAGRQLAQRTQRLDTLRAIPSGVILPLETSLLLVIAIDHFASSSLVKGVIGAATGVGLLLSPAVTEWARRRGQPIMQVAAGVGVLGALGWVVAALGPQVTFVGGSVVGVASLVAVTPLITATYQTNYDHRDRGRRVGFTIGVRVAVGAACGLLFGWFVDRSLDRWWALMLVGAVAAAGWTLATRRIPSQPLVQLADGSSALPHLHILVEDRSLRVTLTAWMIMGFANLMMLPLRVEYLKRPEYGVVADSATVALIVVVIPSLVRLLVGSLFGRMFDHMSFFVARMLVNVLFGLYIALFFTSTSMAGLVAATVVFGCAAAGGDVMWQLWVTKFAAPERVADYMGVHTFLTGVRATMAPLVGYLVVDRLSLGPLALIATGMVLASTAILLPESRRGPQPGRTASTDSQPLPST